MKILRTPTPSNRITCRECDCIYEWEDSDTVEEKGVDYSDGWGKTYTYKIYVFCPGCNLKVCLRTADAPSRE